MGNFTLDDMESLVLRRRGNRLDATGEYDITYYENYINENVKIIEDLMEKVQTEIDLIKDDSIKRRVLNWSRNLVKVYEKNKNKQPRIEYENSPRRFFETGYFQSHKYAAYIESDFASVVDSYSYIINFMNDVFQHALILKRKREVDSRVLYNIFDVTKKACSALGIYCADALFFYDYITSDPESPYTEIGVSSDFLYMDYEIDEDNSEEHDIIITSLPYLVSVPTFTHEGPSKYERRINNPEPKVYYNRCYLQKLQGNNENRGTVSPKK